MSKPYEKNKYKEGLQKSLKISIATLVAILIAGELGFLFSSTAGIITILSIQNTKRGTLKSAYNRTFALFSGLLIGGLCFKFFGFTLIAFAVYLFLFVLLCQLANWGEAIAMVSVLISHFLNTGEMTPSLILNEIGLFVIGTLVGIIINLHLRKKEGDYAEVTQKIDNLIKDLLKEIGEAIILTENQKESKKKTQKKIKELEQAIENGKHVAVRNYNNTIFLPNTGEINYIHMRQEQLEILKDINRHIEKINWEHVDSARLLQGSQISKLFLFISEEYHRDNEAIGLLEKLDALFLEIKNSQLPKTREEFEARAMLYHVLLQMDDFLEIKKTYINMLKENA